MVSKYANRQTTTVITIFLQSFATNLLTKLCSVDCKVEDWSDWTKCSEPCNGGTKTRARGVVQEEELGGTTCLALEEGEFCNTDPCKGNLPPLKR